MDGSSVRLRRQRMLMTQAHLAEASGLSLATIKRVERGENVSFETRRAIAAVLGDEPTEATGVEVSSPADVPRGIYGTVIPLNEAARAAAMLHPGPSGFVSTSPDDAFLVRDRRRRGPKVSVHRFGKAMRPAMSCRVVVGEGISRSAAAAMAATPEGGLPVYEIVPPTAAPGTVAFARLARIAMACSLVVLSPVAAVAVLQIYAAGVGVLTSPYANTDLSGVIARVSREMDWSAAYPLSDDAFDQRRRETAGPDPFADRIRAYGRQRDEMQGSSDR